MHPPGTPTLPQTDPDPGGRRRQVRARQNQLRYSQHLLPGIPMADRIPRSARFSWEFYRRVLEVRSVRKLNSMLCQGLETARQAAGADELVPTQRSLRAMARQLRAGRHAAPMPLPERATCIDDYIRLFQSIQPPGVAQHFRDDLCFAWQRVAGANPLTLHQIDRLPDHFPVDDVALRAVAGGRDSLARAGAEGRLFLVDYRMLDGLQSAVQRDLHKYLSAPLALFVWRLGGPGRPAGLAPVAIQCAQTPGPDTPIFTPRDGMRWLMAKTMVQIADGHVHELVSHLAHTHLVLERFTVATERCFAEQHPLKLLLRPHQQYTLHINRTARNNLLAKGGDVQKMLATTLEAALELVGKTVQAYRFDEQHLETDLSRRGVGAAEALPQYPYRDDARLLWAAIARFVRSYVDLYYEGDAAVVADEELRWWAEELASPQAGRVRGLAAIDSVDRLCEVLTQVIFTASAQHSAVNMTQFEYFGFAPNTPGAAYAPPPGPDTPNTAARYLSMLPPLAQAQQQLDTLYELSAVRINRLGELPAGWSPDPRTSAFVQQFQTDLAEAEEAIRERNHTRLFEYPFLLPSQVAASIHI